MAKLPKVSGSHREYSRFQETATGDRVRSALRGEGGSTALPPVTSPGETLTQRISQDVDIGLVRVDYTFGGSVVARY